MKIHEIIRQRRLEKGLTQEQVANCLGVTAPAVNKWEKAISYPDITLLPALARLLDTDLNTLLCFQDDLSEQEITLFLHQVSETIDKSGFAAGYALADKKLKEFPTCDLLVISLALLLDGAMTLSVKDAPDTTYREKVEALYRRAAQSNDPAIREQALPCLIYKLMGKQDYQQAQELLDTLPLKSPVDRNQIQATIYIAQGELEKAAKLMELKLLSAFNEVHAALMALMDIAVKEGRINDAEYIADVDKEGAELLEFMEFTSYTSHLKLYTAAQNKDGCLAALKPLLRSLNNVWEPKKSPLYRHIQEKTIDLSFGRKLQRSIIQSICGDNNARFLSESREFQELAREFGIELD